MKNTNLFRVHVESKSLQAIKEINFTDFNFKERYDIQEWVEATPIILGEELLIISKELTYFSGTNERPDLIAVDKESNIVIIELKRDDSGSNLEWQAIKYASYLSKFNRQNIIDIFQQYLKKSDPDFDYTDDLVEQKILDFVETDDLENLNKKQRIILVSHRYAIEVTSAVNWLINNYDIDIKCVQLTPFFDKDKNSYYLQLNILLPIMGEDEIIVKASEKYNKTISKKALSETMQRNKNDEITDFFQKVKDAVVNNIDNIHLKPTKFSRWAGDGNTFRYYHFWYNEPIWDNWYLSYKIWRYNESEKNNEKKNKFYIYLELDRKWLLEKGVTEESLSKILQLLKNVNIDGFKYKEGKVSFGIEKRFSDNKMNENNIELLSKTIIELISKTKNEIAHVFSNL